MNKDSLESGVILKREIGLMMNPNGLELVQEDRGGEPYRYYPLGEFVVIAPGVCGGSPTFKGTRLEVQVVLDLLAAGWSRKRIREQYHASGITDAAISEAIRLAAEALRSSSEAVAA